MMDTVKNSTDGRAINRSVKWNTFDNRTIYRSTWRWVIG